MITDGMLVYGVCLGGIGRRFILFQSCLFLAYHLYCAHGRNLLLLTWRYKNKKVDKGYLSASLFIMAFGRGTLCSCFHL